MKEIQLVKMAQAHDADAFCALVERYQAGVIIYCERYTHDRFVAEDIAQDVFVKAYRSIDTYDTDRGAFATWLYAIASSLAKDYIRRSRTHTNYDEIAEVIHTPESLSLSEKNEIRAAVAGLQPPEYALAVRAYYWEGKRYDQIADELGVPASTIGTWLSRAKVQLRKELS